MKKNEETAEDMTIGRVVAEKLRHQAPAPGGRCLDMETLAAFYDRTLTDRERVGAEEHVLACEHCQERLAELARLGDIDEPPVLLDEIPTPQPLVGAHFRVAWAVPILAVLVFLGFWFHQDLQDFLGGGQETAMQTAPPEGLPEPVTKPAKEKKTEHTQPVAGQAASTNGVAASAPPSPPPGSRAEQVPAGPPAVAITGGGAGNAPAPASTDRFLDYGAKEQAAAGRSADVASAPRPTEAEIEGARGLARTKASQLGGVTVRGNAPTFRPQWRVGRQGIIQRADAAGNWVTVPSGVRHDLFEIIFAGDDAGWIVGHEGLVLRSVDGGTTWRKVSSPTAEDLVRVSAVSDMQAQVISRSGRVFATSDGGRTWRSISP